MMARGKFKLLLAVALCWSAGLVKSQAAGTFIWTNQTAVGDFYDFDRWSPNGVPGVDDQANFTNNFAYRMTFSFDAETGSATFNGISGTVTQDIGAGTTWHVTNSVFVAAGNNTTTTVVQVSGLLAVTNLNNTASLTVGQGAPSFGRLFVSGAATTARVDTLIVGRSGTGLMTLSNGAVLVRNMTLGSLAGSVGSMTQAGGTMNVLSNLTIGSTVNATGTVVMSGGTNLVTNGSIIVGGAGGKGKLILSTSPGPFALDKGDGDGGIHPFAGGGGSVLRGKQMLVGTGSGSAGTLTISDGTVDIYSNMVVGDCGLGVSGNVAISGGFLYVTNAAHTAFLDVRSGTVTVSAGLLQVDRLVVTNACAIFIHNGGTLSITTTNLSPSLDADGDGLNNAFEQANGSDPFNPADAGSLFKITSIVRTNNDIRITWTTGTGKTNALERTSGVAGSYSTNGFVPIFTVTNTVGTVTNYLDIGAASATSTSRYYRVRLVP